MSMCTVYADAPGKPRALRVKEIIKNLVTIEWEAPESDGGAAITHYVVKVRHVYDY